MICPQLEVADVLRAYGPAYLEAFGDKLSGQQRRVMHDLVRCRTSALGGHVEECDRCGHRVIAYNSCRNRHCPKCQAATRAHWLEEQAQQLLDTEYYHVVVTLPDEIGPLALQNPRAVYGLLFRASAQALLEVAADPDYLGAEIGFVALLHTWGQNLHLHPHLHCVVPGGGLSADGQRWVRCRAGFFLPVKVLSRRFRDKFLTGLEEAFRQEQLSFHGQQECLAGADVFFALTGSLRQKEWVVYAQPPLGGPEPVLKYLARYVHRVAISNSRLLKVEDDQVHFSWKDYADGGATKVMALPAFEFIRRFLLHVLPSGFVKVRHYGLLANRHREAKLQRCRELLGSADASASTATGPASAGATGGVPKASEPVPKWQCCPSCGQGRMARVGVVERPRESVRLGHEERGEEWDSS